MMCEICGDGQVQKRGNDYVCSKCGALYAEEYMKNQAVFSLNYHGAPFDNAHKYVAPQYEPFQRRMVLFYSPKGSGIEAYQIWKKMTPYTGYPNSDEQSQRASLVKAAEMEKACNPWIEMEPIARCEEEALEYGVAYARGYYEGRMDEKVILTELKNGKISVNSSFSQRSRETKEIELKQYLLITAISKKHWEVVWYLLEHNCDINVEALSTVDGIKVYATPLSAAIIDSGNTEVYDALVKRGADIHQRIKVGSNEVNLLSQAASSCSTMIIKHLLDSGMDPNEESHNTYISVPLYAALLSGRYDNAKVLIDAGADVDYVIHAKEADYTMLNWAVMMGEMQAFNLLIVAHANPNCIRVSHMGGGKNPALFDAVWKKRHEMVKRLILAGADVNCYQERADGNFTLLDQARANLDTEIIPFLISHGAVDKTASTDPVTRLQGKEPPKGIDLISLYAQMYKRPENTTCYTAMVGSDEKSLDVEVEFYLTPEEEKLLEKYARGAYLRDEEPLKGVYKKAFDAVIQQTIRNLEMIGRIVDESSVRSSFLRTGIVIGIPRKY